MFKQALLLWKKERKGTTLHRRLLLFFLSVSIILILSFTLLLTLFGITGKGEKAIQNHMDTVLSIITKNITDDFGGISLSGIALAESISKQCDGFFSANGIDGSELVYHPELIEPLLSQQMQLLISTANNEYCGGTFIVLDASIASAEADSETARSGIFIKKTQPLSTEAVGVVLHYLRGPAQIARDNGIMLLGQWRMEYDISEQDVFSHILDTAHTHSELPLSRLYYWSGRVTLKGNSEAGFLLCVPLRSSDGTVFGLCGIEISDRLFKSMYSPEGGDYENIFTVMAPSDEEKLNTSQGIIAGNYYLTGNRWKTELIRNGTRDGFEWFSAENGVYGGKSTSIKLYPNGSPYENDVWSAALLMPHELLNAAIKGNISYFIYIVAALLIISIVISVLISRRYLRPVTEALNSIRNVSHEERKATPYFEINDLFEFLSEKDRQHEEEVSKLHHEKHTAQSQYDQAQVYISHLANERMPEVDADSFDAFRQYLHTLTPKERMIFDLYFEGKKAKEIMEIAGINQNTMKYHNKNIYSKLGVSSRKQMLEYAALMKYKK